MDRKKGKRSRQRNTKRNSESDKAEIRSIFPDSADAERQKSTESSSSSADSAQERSSKPSSLSDSHDSSVSDDELLKRAKRRKRRRFVIIISVAFTALVVIIAFAAPHFLQGVNDISNLSELSVPSTTEPSLNVSAVADDDSSVDGYPYSFRDSDIISVNPIGRRLLVLTGNSVSVLDSEGSCVMTIPHSYSDPVVKCGKNRCLLYDRATGLYHIFSEIGDVLSGDLGDGVITCDIADNNRFAAVTLESDYSCSVKVYSADGNKVLLDWRCPTERVVCLALSPKGDNVAVGVITAEDGAMVSKVYMLDTHIVETPEPFICKGNALIKIEYVENSKAVVMTNSSRTVISQQSKELCYAVTLDSTLLKGFSSDGEGNTAVSVTNLEKINSDNLFLYNADNEQLFGPVSTPGEIDAVYCTKGLTYILCNGTLLCYDSEGSIIQRKEAPQGCKMLTVCGKNIYCCGINTVYRLTTEVAVGGDVTDNT